MWEVPEVPELNGHPDWSTIIRTSHEIDAAVQEMAENSVDAAHFRFVHNTATVPRSRSTPPGSPRRSCGRRRSSPRPGRDGGPHRHPRRRARASRWSTSRASSTHSTWPCTTPIDADCIVGFSFCFKTMGDEETTRNVGRAVWPRSTSRSARTSRSGSTRPTSCGPALADTDGPFTKFRKWAAQFYAEPVGDERSVYPPPYWPDRVDEAPAKATASAATASSPTDGGGLAPPPPPGQAAGQRWWSGGPCREDGLRRQARSAGSVRPFWRRLAVPLTPSAARTGRGGNGGAVGRLGRAWRLVVTTACTARTIGGGRAGAFWRRSSQSCSRVPPERGAEATAAPVGGSGGELAALSS